MPSPETPEVFLPVRSSTTAGAAVPHFCSKSFWFMQPSRQGWLGRLHVFTQGASTLLKGKPTDDLALCFTRSLSGIGRTQKPAHCRIGTGAQNALGQNLPAGNWSTGLRPNTAGS